MARDTRVASRYLQALEREEFAELPAPVFTKGYIRAYCQMLGVPADEALTRYSESVGGPAPPPVVLAPSAASRTMPSATRARGTLLLSFLLLVGFGLALVLVTVLLQSGRPEVGSRRAAPPVAPVPPQAKVVQPEAPPAAPPPAPEATRLAAAVPEPAAAVPPAPAVASSAPAVASPIRTPTPPPTSARPPEPKPVPAAEAKAAPEAARGAVAAIEPPVLRLGGVASPYRLVARTVESTWLRVRTEDGRATEETIPAGEVREWISNRPFVLTIGNAAGVSLELNGQKLPPLGARGAVISRLVLPPTEP